MNASALRQHLEGEGFRLSAQGSALIVEPASALTTDTRRLIRAHKMELVELVRFHPTRPAEPTEEDFFWRLRVVEDGKAWDVHTLPECTIAEARQLWPKAERVEGLA